MSKPTPGSRTSGKNVPLWLDGVAMPGHAPLRESLRAGACVVGGGFAGLSAAYLLQREGRDVVLLEDGQIASGESGRTTAHLTAVLDMRYFEIERLHGGMGARLAAESHVDAIGRVEAIVREERIDCGFARVDGYLFAARPEDVHDLEVERDAAERAGLAGVALVPRAPVRGWDTGPALRFPGQARLHPGRYLAGLARAFVRRGGRIFCGTRVEEIAGGTPARVVTQGKGEVVAPAVVVATNAPISDRFRLPTKQFAYRTYVVALRAGHAGLGDALLWDTGDPYHYVRTGESPDGEVVVVGGEDHHTGRAEDFEERFDRLESWARTRLPVKGSALYRWSGQVMVPVDGLAYIGREPEDESGSVWVITGHSGNGTTYGTLAGVLLADEIEGRRSRWHSLYDPSRRSLLAAGTWAKGNLGVLPEYADWVTGGSADAAAEIPRGGGAVLRRGLGKLAVHRDDRGALHERSAVCPHLGCIVRWNGSERSWDCPCHGSRFDALGAVVNGPAREDLRAGSPAPESPRPRKSAVAAVRGSSSRRAPRAFRR